MESNLKMKSILARIFIYLPIALMLSAHMNASESKHQQANAYTLIGMQTFEGIDVLGKVVPRTSEEIENSRWGLQFNLLKSDSEREIDHMLERTASSGVKWVRLLTGRFDVSAEDSFYKWQKIDQIINGLVQNNINIFVTINRRDIDLAGSLDSDELDEYLAATSALVKRYNDRIKHWEIMNEPHVTPVYIEAVKEASMTIKKIDPEAKVIAGSLARIQFSQINKLVNEAGAHIDIITFHPYNEFPEAIKYPVAVPRDGEDGGYIVSSMLFNEFEQQLGSEKGRIELWDGEGGYPSSEHTRSWKGRGPWGENIQAKWLLRRFLVNYSLDVPVMIYFYLAEPEVDNKQKVTNAKGLLHMADGEPKRAYKTLQNLTSIFDQRLMTPKEVDCEFEIIDEGSFYGVKGENDATYQMKNPPYAHEKSPMPIERVALYGIEDEAIAYWLPWRMQEYVYPAKVDLSIKNTDIKDPVLVDLLTGLVYQVKVEISDDGMLLKGLPLTDYPMAIVPKHLVKIGVE